MIAGMICSRPPRTIQPDETVRSAAQVMADHHVGTLVVMDRTRLPAGMVTDRDLVVRCLARGRDPDGTRVREIMTRPLATVPEDAPVEQALRVMADGELRRLVVVDRVGRAVGVLSMDDVLGQVARDTADLSRIVAAQLPV